MYASSPKKHSQPSAKEDTINIAILLSIALAIGIYLIVTTVFIAQDGLFYIKQAQMFSNNVLAAIRSHSFGYTFIVFIAHKLGVLITGCSSIYGWIYPAQCASLLCGLLALTALYFVGRLLVGSRRSFWAVFVLVVLPYPAKFGSDVIRAWPYIMFLAWGLLFLLLGAKQGRWWMFGLAGLAAGLGYMIRVECAQLVIYAGLWLLVRLYRPGDNMNRRQVVYALLILVAGFGIAAGPYSRARGGIVPGKLRRFVSLSRQEQSEAIEAPNMDKGSSRQRAAVLPGDMAKAIGTLAEKVNDNLFYFFTPAFLVGAYVHFRKKSATTDIERFFVSAFVLLNVVMLLFLHCYYKHISRRHCLGLVAVLIFYVPVGLETAAGWVSGRLSKAGDGRDDCRRWFIILMTVGVVICLPKLVRPMRISKQGYREAAQWLRENAPQNSSVIVPDGRISFYSERKELVYEGGDTGAAAIYLVKIVTGGAGGQKPAESAGKEQVFSAGRPLFLSGLTGYWPGEFNAEDYSWQSNDGTVQGRVTFASGRYGQAFALNGGGHINCGNSASLNPTSFITISAWIYPTSASHGSIISKNGPYIVEFLPSRKIRAGILAGAPCVWTLTEGVCVLSVDAWHHIVMTYDGSIIKVYIDGVPDGEGTEKSGDMPVTASDLMIGFGTPGADHHFNGLIDEVMIFSRALSQVEIEGLYNEGPETKIIPKSERKISEEHRLWMDKQKKKGRLVIYKVS